MAERDVVVSKHTRLRPNGRNILAFSKGHGCFRIRDFYHSVIVLFLWIATRPNDTYSSS